ncbi:MULTISPECIES: protease HtpX [Bordetella]|uniref:Protease HtpX homolog n=1 Tax=Bordetella genomosp. 6 TaxID=463024 RepID=A0ABX4FBG5_9BORD|nr:MULTISPECIES: protease HtpX [Bordetella]AOB27630.1 zinc metalloprotease HtpX [Bordetella bronchiseptica]ARP77353.1 zinc metalloprotease HtpX [Bordetella genomosp. 6]AZW44951.1 protease HtpX [Bordetella bronchiseptica]KCV62940.1 peptidase, M48 family [Bordetella bronchiseptica 99-R-0433]MBN3265929.1 protease HtpX [Bordetella bronchiseptica]
MKRIFLFLITNLAVMVVLSATVRILGVDRFLTAQGLNLTSLLIFSAVIGFTGAIISLLMSKPMAKWSTGARVIDPNAPANQREAWLLDTVHQLADRAGIGRPEVAIYQGEPNAFATGAFRNDSLVAVSTGLLDSMTEEEVAAVLGHEVAHVANGDMITLTLIQGVVNTFVVFLARVVGYFVDRAILKNERGVGLGYYATVIVCEIVFGILASIIVAWFSRQREYRADAGSAHLMGSREPMIRALARLGGLEPGELPKSFEASGISGKNGISAMFASHPPIQARIAALQHARLA